jgi:hypothetical protein
MIAFGEERADLLQRRGAREDPRSRRELPDAPREELRVLRAQIEDADGLGRRRRHQ